MTKKWVISAIILISLAFAFGSNLEDEIMDYTDSDYIYIGKARQMMADQVRTNLTKVHEITKHLLDKYNNSHMVPVNFWEQFTIGIEIESDSLLLNSIEAFKMADSFENKQFYEKDALYLALDDLLSNNNAIYVSRLEMMELSDEDRMFAHLFLAAISNQLIEDIDQDRVNQMCDRFMDEYPESGYMKFVRNDLRWSYKASNWGLGYDFVGGYAKSNGKYEKYFTDGAVFGFGFYVTYKKIVFRADLAVSVMNAKKDFDEQGNWQKKDPFSLAFYGTNIGYEMFESKKFKFEPHLKFGGSQVDYSPPEKDDEDSEGVLFPAVTPGVGFTLYYKISHNIDFTPNYTDVGGFWYLSLTCDYTYPLFELRYDDYSGGTLNIMLGLGGYLRPIIRDL